jgi:hypothetical protein
MDSDDKFWLSVWALAATVLSILIVSAAVCHYQFVDHTAKAPDPLLFACANGSGAEPVCMAYVVKQ